MCRTISESLTTFLVSSVIGIILLSSDKQLNKLNGIILLSYCGIQLTDSLIHYSLLTDNTQLNVFISKYVTPIILLSEIPIVYTAVYMITHKRIIWFEILLVIIETLALLTYIDSCEGKSIIGKNNYLLWCHSPTPDYVKILFIIGAVIATWYYPNNIYKLVMYIIISATFIITFNYDSFGSGWCHTANILSIAFLIMFLLDIKTK